MREGIHPKWYPEARVICACGNTWTVGAAIPEIRTDVCYNCHPFFTGEQRIVDTAGQVDRYQKRMKRHQQHTAEEQARLALALRRQRDALLRQQVEALDLSERVHKALVDAGLVSIGEVVKKLESGDRDLLAVEGIGPKAVEEVKDRLRAIGLVSA